MGREKGSHNTWKCATCSVGHANAILLGAHYKANPSHVTEKVRKKQEENRRYRTRGTTLPTVATRNGRSKAKMTRMMFCVKCGTRTRMNWIFCGHCGTRVSTYK